MTLLSFPVKNSQINKKFDFSAGKKTANTIYSVCINELNTRKNLPELFRQVEIERYLFSREDRYLRTISATLKTMA